MIAHLPAFGICGWSGAGKTTVIEPLVRDFAGRGLKVAVIKNDVHGLNIDQEGKDSDRFFKAGADVMMRGPKQGFLRAHPVVDSNLWDLLRTVSPHYDLVIVEGHKATPLSEKIWLLKDSSDECPKEATGVTRSLGRDEDRLGIVTEIIESWHQKTWLDTPVCAGILIGGESTRMGRPKHLITGADGRTWLESTIEVVRPLVDRVVLLGQGEVPGSLAELPVLPDVSGARGPIAGMLSAMRWAPLEAWLFLACDMPEVSSAAVEWLLSHRKPGTWAVLPKLSGSTGLEPLLAYYDFRAHHLLEKSQRPVEIASSGKVITPEPPPAITGAWNNVNSPDGL